MCAHEKKRLLISMHYFFFYHPFSSLLSVEFLGSVPPAVSTCPPAYAGKMRIDWPIRGWCQVAFRPPRRYECSLSTSQWQTLGLEREEKKKGSKSERMKTEEGESRKTLVGPSKCVVLLKARLFSCHYLKLLLHSEPDVHVGVRKWASDNRNVLFCVAM